MVLTVSTPANLFNIFLTDSFTVGRTIIDMFNLVPGPNTINAEFQYGPISAADTSAEELITQYLYGNPKIPITVVSTGAPDDVQGSPGFPYSSPYGTLLPALGGAAPIQATFPGLGPPNSPTGTGGDQGLVNDIQIFFEPIEAICKGTVTITFRVVNNLQTPIFIEHVINRSYQGASNIRQNNGAGQDGAQYASFDHVFNSIYEAKPGNDPGTNGYTEVGSYLYYFKLQAYLIL